MTPKKLVARKLLVASIGVATVNYVGPLACGGEKSTTSTFGDAGNDGNEGTPPTSGNLAANPPPPPPTSANLPAPPPPDDAGLDADAEGG